MVGNPVQLVVRGHYSSRSRLNSSLERRQEIFTNGAFRIIRRSDVRSRFGLTVSSKVLQRCKDVIGVDIRTASLESLHRCRAHAAGEVGILPVGLFSAS